MGHERLGWLPKREAWREVVRGIAPASASDDDCRDLTRRTLELVGRQYSASAADAGVVAALGFLVGVANPGREPRGHVPRVDLSEDPSVIRLIAQLNTWVREHARSGEYAALASRAAADALVDWVELSRRQQTLFEDGAQQPRPLARLTNAGDFSELTRLFLSRYTERWLRYFLEREASSVVAPAGQDLFRERISHRVDNISQFAFASSKISQSFAAAWFNKHAKGTAPSSQAVRGLARRAFDKMRKELEREEAR